MLLYTRYRVFAARDVKGFLQSRGLAQTCARGVYRVQTVLSFERGRNGVEFEARHGSFFNCVGGIERSGNVPRQVFHLRERLRALDNLLVGLPGHGHLHQHLALGLVQSHPGLQGTRGTNTTPARTIHPYK